MIAIFLLASALSISLPAPENDWARELASIPLAKRVTQLNSSNCVDLVLRSFKPTGDLKGIVFMPGATDEFYFFRRATAGLTNDAPTLLDALIALTNQTRIQATRYRSLLLFRTAEDPLSPSIEAEDESAKVRLGRKRNLAVRWNDRDWNFIHPLLSFDLDTRIFPRPKSYESDHFFRHSVVFTGLDGMEALEAVALAGKESVQLGRRRIVFHLDNRWFGTAPVPTNWVSRPSSR